MCIRDSPYTYDPEQAKELLANSSYDGRKLTIVSNTSTKKAEETLLAISENMNCLLYTSPVWRCLGAAGRV